MIKILVFVTIAFFVVGCGYFVPDTFLDDLRGPNEPSANAASEPGPGPGAPSDPGEPDA